MNTYKIKAISGRELKLVFTVDANTLLEAQDTARKKLGKEGHRYALIDTITELGPSKAEETPRESGEYAKQVIAPRPDTEGVMFRGMKFNSTPGEDWVRLKAPSPERCQCDAWDERCDNEIDDVEHQLCNVCIENCVGWGTK